MSAETVYAVQEAMTHRHCHTQNTPKYYKRLGEKRKTDKEEGRGAAGSTSHEHSQYTAKFHAYLGSLAAIYTMFSHEEIGLRLSTLHLKDVSRAPYDTGKCIISKHKLYTKKNGEE